MKQATHIEVKVTTDKVRYYVFTNNRKGNKEAENLLVDLQKKRLTCEWQLTTEECDTANSKKWKYDELFTKAHTRLEQHKKQLPDIEAAIVKMNGQSNDKLISRIKKYQKREKELKTKHDSYLAEYHKYNDQHKELEAKLKTIPMPFVISIEINHIIKDEFYDKHIL